MRKSSYVALVRGAALLASLASLGHARNASAQAPLTFTAGDLVVAVEGNGSNTAALSGNTGTDVDQYLDNQAAPLTLYQFALDGTSSATQAGSLMLPQVSTPGGNYAVSGEYGSSSEGALQLSGNGQYLTIMGYGVNAQTYNSTSDPNGTGTALAQSLNGTSSGDVSRVVALIGANGSVNSTTALTNVFSGNNPRSVYTVSGSSFYVSGQGTSGDTTGGVFYATLGATTATPISGADAGNGANQDTRTVMVYNDTLYVSVDSKSGSTNRDYIGTLGTPGALPTSLANGGNGPTMLAGFGNSGGTGKVAITSGANSDGNGLNTGDTINLSAENYFFANATTLYVADSGDPKNNSACSGSGCTSVGDGGLQKWTLNTSTDTWSLDYTLSAGLDLVPNTTTTGNDTTTGLYGLTGEVVGNNVELFATSFTDTDLGATYLYGITDSLSATSASQVSSESFTELATAPSDSDFKGVAFAPEAAPVPLPPALPMLLGGLGILGLIAGRGRARGLARAGAVA